MKTLKIMLALVMLIWIKNICGQGLYHKQTKTADISFEFMTEGDLLSIQNSKEKPTTKALINDTDIVIMQGLKKQAIEIIKPNPVQSDKGRYYVFYVFYPKISTICVFINGDKMMRRPLEELDIVLCDNKHFGFGISIIRDSKNNKEVKMTSCKVASDNYVIYIVTGDY